MILSIYLVALLGAINSATTVVHQAWQVPGKTQVSANAFPRSQPNIVLIIGDDMGVDMVSAYGEGTAPPCTLNIDRLAAEGMLFRNAWASPTCSPTRAALLTGRYGFRTGIGQPEGNVALDLAETTIPEMLMGYESRCVGKWHLNGNGSGGLLHPNLSGFNDYKGSIGGGIPSYTMWPKVNNGSSGFTNVYATRDTAEDAIAAIPQMQEPWLLYVSFNAPHTPLHEPPTFLCETSGCAQSWCGSLGANPSNSDLAKAMVEAMDAEIGRVLQEVDSFDPEALVVFVGDNGTAGMVSELPFTRMHGKGTMYEGGLNVPLIVRGPGVRRAECDALVSVVDLFETFGELSSQIVLPSDSVSLVPYFSNPTQSIRNTVYSEKFSPNGPGPYTTHERAIRNDRYKLIRRLGQSDELFDLLLDPFETSNLLPNLSASEQVAFDALVVELVLLGVG